MEHKRCFTMDEIGALSDTERCGYTWIITADGWYPLKENKVTMSTATDTEGYQVIGKCLDCDANKKLAGGYNQAQAKGTARKMAHIWHGEHREKTGHQGGYVQGTDGRDSFSYSPADVENE